MADQNNFPEGLAPGALRNGTNGLYYPSQSEAEGEDISIHDIMEVLFKNKWIILACFLTILAGTALYTLRMAPEYEARSTVYVNNQPATSEQLGDLLGLETANRNISNEIEIVKSRKIAMRVADQLVDIERVPGTDQFLSVLGTQPRKTPEYKLEVAERLQRRIRVAPISRGVDIVEIIATSTIPREAALISSLFAEEYVDYNRQISRSHMTVTREFLDGIVGDYSTQLQQSEDELTTFLRDTRVVAPDAETSALITQVTTLRSQLNEVMLQLGRYQAEIRQLEAQAETLDPILPEAYTEGNQPYIAQLRQQINMIKGRVDLKYARNPGLEDNPERDPDVVEDLKQIAALEKMLNAELKIQAQNLPSSTAQNPAVIQREIETKKVEMSGLEAKRDLLQGQIQRAEGRLSVIPGQNMVLGRLQRSRETTEEIYKSLVEKLQETSIAEQSELGYVDIVDKAIVPKDPVRPRVQLNLMLGAIFGLFLGFGLAFLRNAVDNKVRKPEDLRKRGHSVVGIIPDMERTIRQDFKGQEHILVEGQQYSTRLVSLLNPLSPIAEGYRRLRTNIQFSRPDAEMSTLMVTSPGPGEGKTVTALNLAVTMAQAGRRTLYIDADLRRPQGHHMMGIPREVGLVDLLFDAVPPNMETFATKIDNYLYVVPAGRDVPNPAEVLGSRKMQKLLARWRQEFDLVIVDTPPTLLVADALILTTQCDATLVVCNAGETNWQAVDRCVESLESVGSKLLGVLLNRFDAKSAYGGYKYGYGYGYEYGYGDYYYYGPSPSEKKPHRLSRNT